MWDALKISSLDFSSLIIRGGGQRVERVGRRIEVRIHQPRGNPSFSFLPLKPSSPWRAPSRNGRLEKKGGGELDNPLDRWKGREGRKLRGGGLSPLPASLPKGLERRRRSRRKPAKTLSASDRREGCQDTFYFWRYSFMPERASCPYLGKSNP